MKNPITPGGYNQLMAELKRLISVERPRVIEEIATAREFGDIAENTEYHVARDRQSFIEGRISELEDKLANSQVVDISEIVTDSIVFGATVKFVDEETDEEYNYVLLGDSESDVSQGIISVSSPIGRALLGKKVGDLADMIAPNGNTRYFEILSITYNR